MYENIGQKIKGLAILIFCGGAIASVISGIVLISNDLTLIGFIVIICGSLVAWLLSLLICGFGQLILNSDIIAEEYKRKNQAHQETVAKNNEHNQNQRRKEINAIISNRNIADDALINCTCPNCKEKLSFTKEQLKNPDNLTCPMCYSPLV